MDLIRTPNPIPRAPILHIVQHLRPGGLEVMALELARKQGQNRPVFVVSLEGTADDAIAAWPRLKSQRAQLIFCGKKPGRDPALLWRLYRLFRDIRPAAVHTHHIGPMLYAGIAARAARVRRILHTEHDAWHLQQKHRRHLARLAIFAARPTLIADAPHVAAAVARALGCAIPQVVLNGVDTDYFIPGNRCAARATLGLPQALRIIGVAARLEPVKGVDIAISALVNLPIDHVLAIAGTGTCAQDLRAQAQALGVADRVIFLGHVDAMAPFYQAIDVLCLPSRDEGLPLSLLEAQASSTPVVAANVGGVAAAVSPRGGRLVAAGDVAGFSLALRAVLADGAHDPRGFVTENASLTLAANAYLALADAA